MANNQSSIIDNQLKGFIQITSLMLYAKRYMLYAKLLCASAPLPLCTYIFSLMIIDRPSSIVSPPSSSVIPRQSSAFCRPFYPKRYALPAGVYPREQLLWPATGGSVVSTPVKNLLQISSFLTNRPNSPIVQLDLTLFIAMNYTISTSLIKVKFKPNTNPNKANLKPIKPAQIQNTIHESRDPG
jgi:hypothetical protein